MQKDHSYTNKEAWNQKAYDAWVSRFGTPHEAILRIKKDPVAKLSTLHKYWGDVKGKKIMNLLGSHGSKAVALALLGADVTVVDIAQENARYAEELANEAGVRIRYIVSDVLELPQEEFTADYDIVFSEFGILHYFLDLQPYMHVASRLLKNNGIFVLQDFHPVSTKLITSKGTTQNIRKHKVTGDYFDTSVIETDVAYSKFLSEETQENLTKVKQRKWTLGEIVTAVAQEGLFIKYLDELPNLSSDNFDKGIPKSFTLVSQK